MTAVKVITLRTGAETPEPVVRSTFIALAALYDNNPVAFYEAVQVARDAAHVTFGNTRAELAQLGLMQDGTMPGTTRDVILAATEGEELDLRLISPFPAPEVTP